MRFLVCLKNTKSGVTYHRLTVPFRYLEKLGHTVTYFCTYDDLAENTSTDDYDFLVFNRGMGYGLHDFQLMNKFKEAGKKIIIDLDDYWELPEHHPIVWRDDVDYPEWKASILANMNYADYIWTSTVELYNEIKALVPNTPIAIAKNALDYEEKQWSTSKPKENTKNVNVGYIGSDTHYMDLDQLKRPFSMINRDKTLKFTTHVMGVSFAKEYAKKIWNHQLKCFTVNNQYPIRVWGGVIVSDYAHFYDQLDVSIASVLPNRFNASKSELKMIESGSKRVPIVCTDYITYSRTEANIDLCGSPEDWYKSLKELILDKELRKELGDELYNYVRDVYVIEKENEIRLNLIR
jgi:hypothetical protein